MNERIDPNRLDAAGGQASSRTVLFDNSLSILNRTGAYHIAKDLTREFVPGGAGIRYWRLGSFAPEGLVRKIVARLMMLEINWLQDSEFLLIRDEVERCGFRLFLDPLYVLRSRLTDNDIVLCHDVGPLTHSELYDERTSANYELAYQKIRRVKPGLVFVSDFSAKQFRSLFGSDFCFLRTIPLYLRTELFDGSAEKVPGVGSRYFLTVGAFETRKNQIAALKAYRDGSFHREGIDYVLCGSRGDGHAEIAELARATPGVKLMGFVPDAQLRWLYANAEAFLLPSLLEGFGMPALEAAYMGLLPIVSADSALVEAVGGQCLQVRPDHPPAIAGAMWKALSRSPEEKAQTSRSLRDTAATATKDRFLQQWKDLLAAHTTANAALHDLQAGHQIP
ncbi:MULTISPECIES: glycosyltransferase [unclassified Mesorhizobium]|uniref:glycosyltransferase n=1 Tax=unclassified Mesorhizobium TaxID=325217 RepID=UPI000F74EB5D|nr:MULTISPECIES: glycosyltransferase [unclassified Mesorhizobium]AZO09412.1 glycosyltransferase family 1 protein [Mesorhizobium sp. M3A.F.Ca.ET.080.04.2.1]RWB67988.1 MAG: glycosyltransferase family 1 protein [Mesorhizobium sp.]RWB87745.1 MAG: glycosyltransferase family 1 protein [Mesorhizobium sp.]RWE36234.1 MAG: glycosyltransferase family 1 protein [Mesorhizobium sp.]RWF26296.1 MAG: glycosyltransferase family 1 protein [Mesorhizobium sp.]